MRHKYKYTDKNWRVQYYDKPFDERHSPQDYMWEEHRFTNYDEAEAKFIECKQSWQSHDVQFAIYDGDNYMSDVSSRKYKEREYEIEGPKLVDEMLRENIIDKNDLK